MLHLCCISAREYDRNNWGIDKLEIHTLFSSLVTCSVFAMCLLETFVSRSPFSKLLVLAHFSPASMPRPRSSQSLPSTLGILDRLVLLGLLGGLFFSACFSICLRATWGLRRSRAWGCPEGWWCLTLQWFPWRGIGLSIWHRNVTGALSDGRWGMFVS